MPFSISFENSESILFISLIISFSDNPKITDNAMVATLILLPDNNNGLLLYRNFDSLFKSNGIVYKSLAIGLLSDKMKQYASLVDYKEKNVKPVEKTTATKETKEKVDDKPLPKKYKNSKHLK